MAAFPGRSSVRIGRTWRRTTAETRRETKTRPSCKEFPGKFDPFIAAEYLGRLGGATRMDRDELERLERQFSAAFPDAHHTIDDLIAEGIEWFCGRQPARRTAAASKASRRLIVPWSLQGSWSTEFRTAESRSHGAKSTSCA
jgi:hypothetical protein